jgi:sulfate transport system ATP-binding protein
MNAGRIEQEGAPAEVFEEPASPFVMRFLGAVNVFRGHVDGGRAYVGDLEFSAPALSEREPAHVFVRPHDLEISSAPAPGSFAARVERVTVLGASVRVELRAPPYGERIEAEIDLPRSHALALRTGDQVHLSPRRVRVFHGRDLEPDSLTASGL